MASNNSISILISAKDDASTTLRKVSDQLDGTSHSTSKLKEVTSAMAGTMVRATAVVGAAAAAAGAAATAIGFGFNSSVEQAQTKLMAFMKDGDKVAQTLAWVKDEAAKTQFSFTDMADAAANLTPVAKTSGKSLEDLVQQAEILAAINPTEGLTGATFSLREALSGDWVSIVDRFNLPRKRINELKEQGVPAMEIISRTLQEMGIDYSLVEKQGQTVAARFDQVKDKLVMMAGAATKPIFDRVSQELGNLGAFDFTALGDNLAGVVSGAIRAVDEFIPKVQELGREVWDYLGPKFEALWQSIQTNLIPALEDLWHNVIEPLIPVFGQLLVGAIGAVADVLTAVLDAFGYVYAKIKEGDPFWVTLVATLGGVATALAMSAAFNAFNTGMLIIRTVTIPAVMAQFGVLSALIASPLIMPAIAVGAAIAALYLVRDAAFEAQDAVQAAKNAESYNSVSNDAAYRRLKDLQKSGDAGQKARASEQLKRLFPGRASGGPVQQGISYTVGEHGPETFTPATSGTVSSNTSSSVIVNFYGPVSMRSQSDIESLGSRIDKTQRLAKVGMA